MKLIMCTDYDIEYIYNKIYKDDCCNCKDSNIVDTIYCQCEKSNDNTISIVKHGKLFNNFVRCNVLKLQAIHYSQRLSS